MTIRLGKMQLQIMQVLWHKGEATAREITESLNQTSSSPVAHSTVQTLLRGLEDKQALDHRVDGRTFVFFPVVEQQNVRRSATRDLIARVFDGRPGDLVAYLLENETVSRQELDEIRKLINDKSNELD